MNGLPFIAVLREVSHGSRLDVHLPDLFTLHLLHHVDEIVDIDLHLHDLLANGSVSSKFKSKIAYRWNDSSVTPRSSWPQHDEVVRKARRSNSKIAPCGISNIQHRVSRMLTLDLDPMHP